MRLFIVTAAALSALMLRQCSPKADTDAAASSAVPAAAPSFAYDINLALTPAALAAVEAHKQKVTVSVMYYGNVTPASQALADPKDGTLHLDTDVVEVDPTTKTVHMTGAGANVPHLKDITGQKPLALLIVYAGKSPDTSSIRCTDFQDYVSAAQESPITLKCDAA
jgi:hypothetical protein